MRVELTDWLTKESQSIPNARHTDSMSTRLRTDEHWNLTRPKPTRLRMGRTEPLPMCQSGWSGCRDGVEDQGGLKKPLWGIYNTDSISCPCERGRG